MPPSPPHRLLITNSIRKPFFRKPNKRRFIRVNEKIKIPKVRVIDEDGKNLGILDTSKALELARNKGLDLVEVSANANPPVCRITDYGKYQYAQEKKQKKQKQKRSDLKGIRIGFTTSVHDLETKAKQADKFLKQGHKARIEMRLKGRQRAHKDLAIEKIETFLKMISREFKREEEIKRSPRGMAVTICPVVKSRQLPEAAK